MESQKTVKSLGHRHIAHTGTSDCQLFLSTEHRQCPPPGAPGAPAPDLVPCPAPALAPAPPGPLPWPPARAPIRFDRGAGGHATPAGVAILPSTKCPGIPKSAHPPSVRVSNDFDRSCRKRWAVVVKQRQGDRCELCGWCEGPCDVHHRIPKSMGGETSVDNGIVLCPNCHRLAHRVQRVALNKEATHA